jgi:hypothetical protein
MSTVYLTPTEINYAYAVAELRHENAKHNQHQDRFKGEFKNTLPDKIGALGEFALAKYLNVYWGYEPYDPKANDVGRYEVRTTPRPDGCLETYAYKASKTHDRTLYFHPGTCKKAAYKNGI